MKNATHTVRGEAMPTFLLHVFRNCVIATFAVVSLAVAAADTRLGSQTAEDHIAVGDVTERGAVIWFQAEQPGTVTMEIAETSNSSVASRCARPTSR
jgi:hypothetical protein